MSAVKYYFSKRSSALAGMLLYLFIDASQNLHTWLLEHTDWAELTPRDFWILGNGIILSGLIVVKTHISTSWHKPSAPPANANPQ